MRKTINELKLFLENIDNGICRLVLRDSTPKMVLAHIGWNLGQYFFNCWIYR